jgi:hypothetical protein
MAAFNAYLQLALVLISFSAVCGQMMSNISCYQCNSGADFNGAACIGKNGPSQLAQFLAPCPYANVNGIPYTRCRTMTQAVESDSRTIRMCATAGSGGPDNCINIIGTARVTATYCQCHPKPLPLGQTTPTTACNTASQRLALTSYALAVTSLLAAGAGWLGGRRAV